MPERRYDKNELAAILRTAAEAQAGEPDSDDQGFTLAEIERLAQEVGIDPALVPPAAEKLGQSKPQSGFRLGGAPTREIIERNFDGLLDDTAWEDIVGELRAAFGSAGTVSTVGSSREWVGGTDTRSAHFSATPRNGRTRFRLSLRQEGGIILTWLGSLIASFLGSIIVGITLGGRGFGSGPIIIAILGVVAASLGVAHRFLNDWRRRNLQTVDSLMNRVRELTPQQGAIQGMEERTIESELPARLSDQA